MPKYDLMFGCFGNGTTVCNRAQTERGDYKIIAHISEGGNVTYYDKLPADIVERIEKTAADDKQKFQAEFIKLPKIKQYEIILDSLPMDKWSEYRDRDMYNKEFDTLLAEYFERA